MSEKSKPLRILYLVFNETGKGTFWRAYYLGLKLAQFGHEITIISQKPETPLPSIDDLKLNVRIVESPAGIKSLQGTGWDPFTTCWRRKWIRGKHFDIVHAFETRPANIYPALMAVKSGAKLVFDWADWFGKGGSVEERSNKLLKVIYRPIETYFEEHFRTWADGTTVINSFLKARANGFGISSKKIMILHNGCQVFFPWLRPQDIRKQLNFPMDDLMIGFVGKTFEKDLDLLAEAFNLLNSLQPDSRLFIIGYFNRKIKTKVSHPENIIFSGPIKTEQVQQFLSACDICWLPLNEIGANIGRFPIKFNDYLSVGRPIIATDVGELGRLIKEFELGFALPANPLDFAKVTLVLYQDKDRMEAMGKNAYRMATTELSWSVLAKELVRFYQDTVLKS